MSCVQDLHLNPSCEFLRRQAWLDLCQCDAGIPASYYDLRAYPFEAPTCVCKRVVLEVCLGLGNDWNTAAPHCTLHEWVDHHGSGEDLPKTALVSKLHVIATVSGGTALQNPELSHDPP